MIPLALDNIQERRKQIKIQNFLDTQHKIHHPLEFKPKSGRRCCSWINGSSVVFAINVVVVLACTTALVFQTSQCFLRFFLSETKAILSVKPSGDTTFLAFTFCPSFKDAYETKQLQSHGLNRSAYINGQFFGNPPNTNFSGYEIFTNVTYDLAELVKSIKISMSDPKVPSVFIDFNGQTNSTYAHWTTIHYDTFGRCYQMYLYPEVTQLQVINMEVKARAGIFIYLHHPGQMLDVDSKTKVFAELGQKLFLDLAYEVSTNTLEQDGEIPCNSSMNWNYDDCVGAKISDELWNSFGCVLPFLPPQLDRKICRFDASSPEGLELKSKIMSRFQYLSSTGQRNLCSLPCSTMEVFLGLPFGGVEEPDTAYVKMYIKSTVKVKKTVLDYTWLSMLAEVGGYTGLLLGISVVNITVLVDKVFAKIWP